ncbi:MAG: PAS domain S-box protein, partial [Mariniphaga sp.]
LVKHIAELETLLASNNERFDQFSVSTGIWIWEVNPLGLFTYVSHMVESILGYKAEELIGKKSFYDLYDPVIKDRLKAEAFEVFSQKRTLIDFENQNLHRNGRIIILETNGSPILDKNGTHIGYRCANRDITQSRKDLDNLHKLNRLYSVISHVNRAITGIKDKKKLYEEICRVAVKYGNFRMAWIGLVNEETQTIKPFAHAGFEEGYLSVIKPISVSDSPEGRGPSGSAIREGRHFICSDFETDPLVAPWRYEALRRGYRSSIALPIKESGKVIGAFTIYAPSPRFFDEPEVELLFEVASDISFAIDTIELEQQHEQTRLELINSEQKYRMLTENMKDVVWIADAKTLCYTYLGPSIEKLLGYKVEEMLGVPLDVNQFAGKEGNLGKLFNKRFIDFKSTAQNSEIKYYTDESTLLRKDGTLVYTEVTTHFKYNTLSGSAEIHGLTHDIHERKQLREHELETKNRFAEIFDSITDGFIAFDSKMNYTFLNKRGAALLGYLPSDLLGKNYWLEFPEAKGTPFANAYLQVLETRTPYTVDDYYAPWDRWFENRIYPTTEGIAVYFSETTERKKAEKLIIETSEKLKRAQHMANVGSWEANLVSGQVICSEEMYRIMGIKIGTDLKIEDITNRFAPGESDRFYSNTLKSRENNTNHKAIYRIIRADGKERYIHHEDETQKDEQGRAILVFGTSQDITDRILAEEETLQTKNQFQAMFEHSPMGIALVETQTGVIMEANLMFLKIIGRSTDKLNSVNWMEITHPEDLQIGMAQMELLKSKKLSGYKLVKRYCKPDGTIVWVNMIVAAIQNDDQSTKRHLAMIEDITDKKANEDQVLVLSQAVEQSPVSVVITDTNGNIEYVNEKFSKITGYSLEEAIGNNPRILKSDTKSSHEYSNLWGTITSGQEWRGEFLNVKKNGETYSESATISPITDDDGKIVHFLAVKEDITEQKKVTAQLKTLSAVVEQSPLMIIITGADRKIEYANSTFINFVQYSLEGIKGKTPWIFNPKHLHHDSFNQMWEVLNEGNVWQSDSTNRKKDGTIFWEQVVVFPLLDNIGSIRNFIIISSDITEKKQLLDELITAKQKAEESNQLKTAFINNISHEIRTPLNGILGFGDLISQPDITEVERAEYLHVLQKSTDRLIQTVTDYMDISKIVTGNMEVNKSDFDIREFFEELLYQTRKLSSKKIIEFIIELPQTENSLIVFSDRFLISKAMLHLLSNAEKFTHHGSITFGYHRLTNWIEFFVKDTGVGIAEDKLFVIFNAYLQEDISTTRGYEGSGLGLAIVKGIANLLDGKTWAESVKGEGAEFHLSIPCLTTICSGKPKEESTLTIEKEISKNRIILIAEDVETNYEFLKYLLDHAGYETLHAMDGERAVEFCKRNEKIGLILMDIKMPVMDGIEATRQIKQFRTKLPIIAITAFAQTVEENQMREAGCDDVLAKPFRKEELLFKISKYIKGFSDTEHKD